MFKNAGVITFYDNEQNFLYFSNYLEGFLNLQCKFQWKSAEDSKRINMDKIPKGVMVFSYKKNREELIFCIDTNDTPFVHEYSLSQSNIYFKVNKHKNLEYAENVHSCSPCFPVSGVNRSAALRHALFNYLSKKGSKEQIKLRLKHLYHSPSEAFYRELRTKQNKYSVFFVTGLYPEAVHNEHNEFRYELVRALKKNVGSYTNSKIGLVANDNTEKRFSDMLVPRVKVKQHLINMAESKVNVYVRGVHDCISFKFPQIMAMGGVALGQKVYTEGAHINKIPRKDDLFSFESIEEIVKSVAKVLNNEDLMSSVGTANSKYYDDSLSVIATVQDVLNLLNKNF